MEMKFMFDYDKLIERQKKHIDQEKKNEDFIMANIYRRLAAHLEKDIKTAIELARQAQEFAENVSQQEVDQKNPYIYAVAMSLQHFYTALETAFERVVKELDGEVSDGEHWYFDLLEEVCIDIEGIRPAFISSDIKNELDRLRRFRHIVRHGYEYELDWSQIQPLIKSLDKIIPVLKSDVKGFKTFLMKSAEEIENID